MSEAAEAARAVERAEEQKPVDFGMLTGAQKRVFDQIEAGSAIQDIFEPSPPPVRKRNLAICGPAESLKFAPVHRAGEWEIWGHAGAWTRLKQWDRWFELHQPKFFRHDPEGTHAAHWAWLRGQGKPIYTVEPVPEISSCVVYPKKRIVDLFGSHFFTSTAAWMLALAIEEGWEHIGLFGIEMANDDEHRIQRKGVQHFLGIQTFLGRTYYLPEGCDLAIPGPLYGFDDPTPWALRLEKRKETARQRLSQAEAEATQAQYKRGYYQGMAEDCDFFRRHLAPDE